MDTGLVPVVTDRALVEKVRSFSPSAPAAKGYDMFSLDGTMPTASKPWHWIDTVLSVLLVAFPAAIRKKMLLLTEDEWEQTWAQIDKDPNDYFASSSPKDNSDNINTVRVILEELSQVYVSTREGKKPDMARLRSHLLEYIHVSENGGKSGKALQNKYDAFAAANLVHWILEAFNLSITHRVIITLQSGGVVKPESAYDRGIALRPLADIPNTNRNKFLNSIFPTNTKLDTPKTIGSVTMYTELSEEIFAFEIPRTAQEKDQYLIAPEVMEGFAVHRQTELFNGKQGLQLMAILCDMGDRYSVFYYMDKTWYYCDNLKTVEYAKKGHLWVGATTGTAGMSAERKMMLQVLVTRSRLFLYGLREVSA